VPDGKIKGNILTGSRVKIVEKKNQDTGLLTEGVVKEVLTKAETHPYGIKVVLENGAVGRVKEIIESNSMGGTDTMQSEIQFTLPANEDQYTEFKATFRFDLNRFQHTGENISNKEVEKSISKTVAAFMNSEGGTLYIGVDDNGKVSGLQGDYKILKKSTSDSFRLVIKNSLESYLKNKIIFEYVHLDIVMVEDKEVCIIRVLPSSVPIFVNDNGKQECYVRVDNESKPYGYDEFLAYWQRRSSKN
jgi:uncharacterized repeat protein (TIGR03833 family)